MKLTRYEYLKSIDYILNIAITTQMRLSTGLEEVSGKNVFENIRII